MNITCPYCHSENVSRVIDQQPANQGSLSSMTCAGIGASISKSLPMPISPWMGGIAGAVVGGLIDSFIQPARPAVASVRYFHCQDRKSTRLNSSHVKISYAVFCLKKKKN